MQNLETFKRIGPSRKKTWADGKSIQKVKISGLQPGNPDSIGVHRMASKRGFPPESKCLEASLVRGLVAQL